MSKTVKYDVLREHEGDRFYRTGDTREMAEADAKQLLGLGVLAPHDPDQAKGKSPAEKAISGNEARLSEKEKNLAAKIVDVNAQIAAEESRLAEAVKATSEEMSRLEGSLRTANDAAKAEIDRISAEVAQARTDADAEIAEIKSSAEKAKAEIVAANKAEKVPNNKAG